MIAVLAGDVAVSATNAAETAIKRLESPADLAAPSLNYLTEVSGPLEGRVLSKMTPNTGASRLERIGSLAVCVGVDGTEKLR